eukprot:TRINITY_DN5104_c2_g1_i3.p2 TRINITY_DN5104_c2_g1~~TRINITY_DN5104_c2_g1_i3.p2  ORF type:complete len:174 (+),score=28.55 TRINITY_DN5104_c2_g1_i3:702-1223(+)
MEGTNSVSTFMGKSESVRDISFSPFYPMYYLAAFENGTVQIVDHRKPEKYYRRVTAHQGNVLTIAWHPSDKNQFASAGRDRTVKVHLYISLSLSLSIPSLILSSDDISLTPSPSRCRCSFFHVIALEASPHQPTHAHHPHHRLRLAFGVATQPSDPYCFGQQHYRFSYSSLGL